MHPVNILAQYFPKAGTAEAETGILDAVFVPLRDYLTIINPDRSSPRLLAGRKGSGKSAFIRVFRNKMRDAKIPVLLLKPEHLNLTEFGEGDAVGEMTKKAKASLLEAIGNEIGSQLSTFVTNAEETVLAKFAQNNGARKRDLGQTLLGVLSSVARAKISVDFAQLADFLQSTSVKQVQDAIYGNISKGGKVFFLLIDDTDQVASPMDYSHLNRIWAFILAARSILDECESLRIIITLRWEVWARLQRDRSGQRDQVDHFRGLIYALNPDEENVRQIIIKRLDLAKQKLKEEAEKVTLDTYGDQFQPFFEGGGVVIPTTDTFTSWPDLIIKRSRERPRDAIQLVGMLAESAERGGRTKIAQADVAACLKRYSEERAEDLKREADEECPQIKEVIRSFAQVDFDSGSFKSACIRVD
jgi:hypothetical protein